MRVGADAGRTAAAAASTRPEGWERVIRAFEGATPSLFATAAQTSTLTELVERYGVEECLAAVTEAAGADTRGGLSTRFLAAVLERRSRPRTSAPPRSSAPPGNVNDNWPRPDPDEPVVYRAWDDPIPGEDDDEEAS